MIRIITRNITAFDIFLMRWIYQLNGKKKLDRFFYLLTRSGDGLWYLVLGAALLLANFSTGSKVVVAAMLAFSIEVPLYVLIKKTIRRERPFQRLSDVVCLVLPPDKFSFPSGHTAAAFLVAHVLAYFYPILFWPLRGWASLVGISRVYLGVHFPTDILAGFGLGIMTAKIGLHWAALI